MLHKTFVQTVKKSLFSIGIDFNKIRADGQSIGLGISGGADSVALFLALKEILSEEKIPLVCITVNHHIREESETNGDMDFVKELCRKAREDGFDVSLDVYDLKNGEVQNAQKERKSGTEEAARYVRYSCFEKSVSKNRISYFCLAHHMDDNLETILMRFLKGSSSGGIEKKRGIYIRPLLNVTRADIENFLKELNQDFCTDSTNLEDEYLRNRIRHNLIPVLDVNFPDWRQSVLSGDEKRRADNRFLDSLSENSELSPELFLEENSPLGSRVLIKEMNKAGAVERIPSDFIQDFSLEVRKSMKTGKTFSKRFSNVEAGFRNREVFVKTYEKTQTDSGFFDIIENSGVFQFPFGEITVKSIENADGSEKTAEVFFEGKCVTTGISFPFVIRSPQLGEKKQLFVVEGN